MLFRCQLNGNFTLFSLFDEQPAEDGSKRLTDLPEELIREILLRLTDYKDLMNSGQAYDIMQSLLDEQHIWRQLCKYHYTRAQLRWAFANNKSEKVDWELIFHQLRKYAVII